MRKFTFSSLALCIASATGFSGTDSCEDLSHRLYRADLAPVSLKLHSVKSSEVGDHQLAELTLKNVGTVKVGSNSTSSSEFNVAPIRVKFGKRIVDSYVSLPVQVGAKTVVHFRLPDGYFDNCETIPTEIDLKNTAKQNGCDCFDNDDKVFTKVQIVGETSCQFYAPNP